MNVVLIAPLAPAHVAEIEAVGPCVRVANAWEDFAPEMVAEWPAHTVNWYLPARLRTLPDSEERRARREALLREAEAIFLTFPFPLRIASRAPRLRFVHQYPAGVSNLERGDLWHGPVPVTSGRGAGNTLAIAEWAIAGMLAMFKDLPRSFAQRRQGRFDRSAFHGRQVAGKTLGVVGLGGIGGHVARLGKALGMHVLGTRRSSEPVEGVDEQLRPDELPRLLAHSDVVVLATQVTPETFHLIDARALEAIKPGALLINVARGELIDEAALLEALRAGKLAGFTADVYDGEFDHEPPAALLALDNVILTPHVSGNTDQPSTRPLEIFKENLRRCLAGEPLLNQVDWSRGY